MTLKERVGNTILDITLLITGLILYRFICFLSWLSPTPETLGKNKKSANKNGGISCG